MGLALSTQFERCPTGTRLLAALYGISCGGPLVLSSLGLPTDAAVWRLFLCCTANVLGRRTRIVNGIRYEDTIRYTVIGLA